MNLRHADPVRERALARVGRNLRGKFRLDGILGVGGMAAVYSATHRNGSRVAIKILHEHVSASAEARRLFRGEALAANRVSHPSIVRVLDDDVAEDGCAFLVMPLLEGETVQARRERLGSRLPVEEALLVAAGVLDALRAAHRDGVIHRDIKPENIFVTREGELRILDFGVARIDRTAGDATRTGTSVGTPAFMPPEQALGRTSEIDARSDLWSVGATLFTCLTGEHVHEGKTAGELAAYAAMRRARSLRSVMPEAHPKLVELVDTALGFEKEARWGSAEVMLEATKLAYAAVTGSQLPLPVRLTQPPNRSGNGPLASPVSDVHSLATRIPEHPARVSQNSFLRRTALALALVAAGLVGVRLLGTRHPASPPTAPTTSAGGAEEAAAYQSWRDASISLSLSHATKAVAENPTLARAHLLVSIDEFWSNPDAQASLERAWEYRSQLNERELAILEAYRPAVAVAPDAPTARDHLAAVVARYPDYDLAAYALAHLEIRLGRLADAETTMNAFLRGHEQFPIGWQIVAKARVLRGDVEGARTAYRRCLELSPTATSCLSDLTLLRADPETVHAC